MRIKQVLFITIFAIVCGILGMIFYPTTKEKAKEFDSSYDIIFYVVVKHNLEPPFKLGTVDVQKETNVQGWALGLGNKGKVKILEVITFSLIDCNNKTVIIRYIDNGPGKKVKLLSTIDIIKM
jgi:hypothetical protein